MVRSFTTLCGVLLLATTFCVAQYEERIHQFLPSDSRRFFVADMTKALEPVMLLAGDGVVTAVPGGGFADVTQRYADRIFDGVAAIDTATAFAGTGDGTIIRLDLLSRREVRDGTFPTNGSSLVRCGTMAAAVRDGYIIRLRRVGDVIVTDTLLGAGAPHHLLSACSGTMAVAIDTVRNKLTLVDLTAMRVEAQRAVPRNVSFLQSLSDSVSVVMASDSTNRIVVLWHHGDDDSVVASPPPPIEARLSASHRGGGAIVWWHTSVSAGVKRKILYAVGSRVDSANWTYDWRLAGTETIEAGVAWWYRSDAMPVWHVATPYTLHTTVDTSGAAAAIAGSPFLRGKREVVSPMMFDGERTLGLSVRRSQVAPRYTAEDEFLFSVDGGESWTVRPAPTRPVALDGSSRVISVSRDSSRGQTVHLGTLYSTNASPVLTIDTTVTGAHIVGDTLLVFSTRPRLYRSVDLGITWDSVPPPTWFPGSLSHALASTIVCGGSGNSGQHCLTTDAGRTWRELSFVTTAPILSSVPLADTAVLASWRIQHANAISESDGTITALAQPGFLAAFTADNVYYGTLYGMRAFDRITRSLGENVFTTAPYAVMGAVSFTRSSVAVAPLGSPAPVFDRDRSIWFLAGARIKEIRRLGPTSVPDVRADGTWVMVSPNPASGYVTLPAGQVRITTSTGERIMVLDAFEGGRVDVSSLPQGTYQVQCRTSTGAWSTTPLVITR